MVEDETGGKNRTEGADMSAGSGWVTTEVAAKTVRVSPRTIRRFIERGKLEARTEGEGVERRWLVSVDSLNLLKASRNKGPEGPQNVREGVPENTGKGAVAGVLRELSAKLETRTVEAVEMRARLEITERAQSSAEEEARRLREENARLREELEAERNKGFWRRLFDGAVLILVIIAITFALLALLPSPG